jgi:hypothetical protein
LLGRQVINPAAATIAAALTQIKTAPGSADLIAAEAHARALGRSRRLAKNVGLESAAFTAVSNIREKLSANIGEMLLGGAAAVTDTARRSVFGTIRLFELVAGPEEAERVLRQAQKRLAPEAEAAEPTADPGS